MKQNKLVARISNLVLPRLRRRLELMAEKKRMLLSELVREMLLEAINFYEAAYIEPEREMYYITLTEVEASRLERLGYNPAILLDERDYQFLTGDGTPCLGVIDNPVDISHQKQPNEVQAFEEYVEDLSARLAQAAALEEDAAYLGREAAKYITS